MHDLLEGVCVYVMREIIFAFIFLKDYFTLQTLNVRIENFDFGPIENSNKPPPLLINTVKNKVNCKMSASEMLCFVRYFGLIVGDLIPENDKHWELYKYLRQIIDIVTSPRIIRSDAKVLKKLIEDHNQLYIDLCGTLKPKFHILLYYPTILLNNGPLINFWSMRYELKHRQVKAIAQSTNSNKNLLITIANKQLLKMCQMIHSAEFETNIKFDSRDNSESIPRSDFCNIDIQGQEEFYKQVEINGTLYKIGTFLVLDMKESEVEFGTILKILRMKDNIFFIFKIFREITFDDHVHAFIVNQNSNETKLVNHNDLPNIAPALPVQKNNTLFIALQYKL